MSGDPVAHVVKYDGEYYLIDGHNRMIRTLLDGHYYLMCRVLEVEDGN